MGEVEHKDQKLKMTEWQNQFIAKVAEIYGDYDETVYHYTDSRGLIGILSTGKVWATHVARLNDATAWLTNDFTKIHLKLGASIRVD
jgi:hypothetical protein